MLAGGLGGLGGIVIGGPSLPPRLGRWTYVDQPVAVAVLQDREGLRALIVPTNAGATTTLTGGDHRLTLTLERKRFDTTAPADTPGVSGRRSEGS